jgi:hypothetical protein
LARQRVRERKIGKTEGKREEDWQSRGRERKIGKAEG